MKRFEFSTLQVFLAVAESGSLSRAAARVNLAVAAVSKRILDLEEAVGAALFDRHARGVTLTPAGTSLAHHARELLARVDAMRADLSEYARGIRGQVRLAANESAITQFLPAELKRFADAHPRLVVNVTELQTRGIVEAVLEGRADVGIFVSGPVPRELGVYPYRSDELCVVVPARHPLARRRTVRFDDLLEEDFVGLQPGSALSDLLIAKGVSRLKSRVQVRSFDSVCRMVEANLGIAVLPRGAAAPHASALQLRLVALDEPWARRDLVIGVRAIERLPVPARALLDHLRSPPAASASV